MGNTWYSVSKLTLFVHHFTPVFSLFSGGTALCMMVRLNSHAGLRSFIPNIIQMLFRLVDHPTSCLVVFFSLLYIIKADYWKETQWFDPGSRRIFHFCQKQTKQTNNTHHRQHVHTSFLFIASTSMSSSRSQHRTSTPRLQRSKQTTKQTFKTNSRTNNTHKVLNQNHQQIQQAWRQIPPPITLSTQHKTRSSCDWSASKSWLEGFQGVFHKTSWFSLVLHFILGLTSSYPSHTLLRRNM